MHFCNIPLYKRVVHISRFGVVILVVLPMLDRRAFFTLYTLPPSSSSSIWMPQTGTLIDQKLIVYRSDSVLAIVMNVVCPSFALDIDDNAT